ncbi:hypothetical protein GUITHDRAFT_116901 [Guillardia theta CCMP2712]|uniref:PDZ domain-containing protein n=1 Tax=Guillardia theta (strain CCMP2712) TaxID=905079 RepID=L1ILW4_GUITC|nr:hypothetical protein GUITHDRAFT_116901 [Guillardia theta CCMP2712]EKX36879.1 hypothetical protein GUITHDRAFT_116901 [Guillardia theta CCMP2712]|eukprot:XP_005823859.1 hypothetical protein GUITHDRAFT_116901 [Guillardia theta CCMP2712]
MDLFGIFGKKDESSTEQKPSDFEQQDSVQDRLYALEKLIEKSESYCDLMHTLIEKDVLSVETQTFANASAGSRSTVGIMIKGVVIDNLLTGGPAANSKKMAKGDTILKVDGKSCTSDNVLDLLRGEDVPGSLVVLTLQRNREEFDVALARMATGELADKKKMFELFTAVKDHAVKSQDRDVASIVDESITLWTNMLEADAVHDQTIVDNVQAMQLEGIIFVKKLKELLAQLRAIYVQDMKFFQKPLSPSQLADDLKSEKGNSALLEKLQKENADMKEELAKLRGMGDALKSRDEEIERLKKQLKEEQEGRSRAEGELKNLRDEHMKCDEIIKELRNQLELSKSRVKLGASAPRNPRCGVGIVFAKDETDQVLEGKIFVQSIVPGGAAADCKKIQPNDVLEKIDGKVMGDLQEVFQNLVGMEGTEVTLELSRASQVFTVTLNRKPANTTQLV